MPALEKSNIRIFQINSLSLVSTYFIYFDYREGSYNL